MIKQIIEIDVKGPCGSGKTEVMKVIEDALIGFYGHDTQVASPELENEKRNSHKGIFEDAKFTGQRCRQNDTVFILTETIGNHFERDGK